MVTPRILATITDYAGLMAALRARADELGASRETLDAVAGLADGHASKILAPVPIKVMGRVTLGPMLGAMAVKLLLVEDAETIDRIRARIVAHPRMLTMAMLAGRTRRKRLYLAAGSDWGRIMRARGVLKTSPKRRRQIARLAARVRWGTKPAGAPRR